MSLGDDTHEGMPGYEMRLQNNDILRRKARYPLSVIVSADGDEILVSDEPPTRAPSKNRKKCLLLSIVFCVVVAAGVFAAVGVVFSSDNEPRSVSAAQDSSGEEGQYDIIVVEVKPSPSPTLAPTEVPTAEPTEVPTVEPTEVPTVAPNSDPNRVKFVEYEIIWEGVVNGCQGSLSMNASCPMNAVVESNLYKDCYLDSPRSVHCKSQADAPIKMGCYGQSAEDLQLEVIVSADSYHCTKMLHEASALVSYFGGNVTTAASATALCQDSTDLTCLSNSSHKTPMNGQSLCTESGSCQVERSCAMNDKDFVECVGEERCDVQVDPVGFQTSIPSESCFTDFYLATEAGEPCQYDVMCSSNVCVGGTCMAGQLADGEACKVDNHCLGGTCARSGLDQSKLMCCPSGEAVNIDGNRYCTQSKGATCLSNDLCTSGICVEGQCREDLVPVKGICDDDEDCISGSCAHFYTNSSLACCFDGKTLTIDNKTYCTELPTGSPCIDGESCESGMCIFNQCSDGLLADEEVCAEGPSCANGACGYPTAMTSGDMICCPEGKFLEKQFGFGDSTFSVTFCKGVGAGKLCGTYNELCASGLCDKAFCT